MASLELTYLLPLRWRDDSEADELTFYLRWLSSQVDQIVVVDGSEAELFASHRERWGDWVRHLAPDPELGFRNGKVNGVTTGMNHASCERVVIADDDVRYDRSGLERMAALLDRYDLVRPQNYFEPLPWHAAWDTGRTLLNRAFGSDYPGTLGLRRELFRRTNGYDGDVLFENLELIRTVAAAGGTEVAPLDLYVRRLPPDTSHFIGQRVRQAYDEFALPARLMLWLSLVPALALAAKKRSWWGLALGLGAAVGTAEVGRRKAGGTGYFPARTSLWAPVWLLERGVCSWIAVGRRFSRGGVSYADGVVARAATPVKELKTKLA